ncbi:DEAD/DEAH box helicase [Pontibacter cellulosilyticus]|uniref:DEAD/DEAH box helicase n=1 Tax=Pontibacter cellulosilyticus TaxID=1720253 RepID=A0A923NC38_9BACT|nr:DEAD/DEAH box helicase [Pontibacter cellulosilyticus]MBC5994682.1 DEAD/DEAH box helicase [Pontibacter cellulosilyticus]
MAEEAEKEVTTFEDFKLNKQLLNAINDAGYEKPTPIQQQAIPIISGGHDVLGIAQTGTGKTAAFLLPLLMKVKYAQGQNPRALIVAPTRELVMQIEENITLLAKYTDIRHTAIYGGLGPKTQIETINKGIDILVATPKRLMELYLKGDLILKELKTLILDEADKMMDMGFMPQIRQLLEVIPRKRQNLLFSATMPDKVVQLSEEFLEFPTRVEITPQATPVETVTQTLYRVPNLRTKIELLEHIIQDEETFNRVIIFTRSKKNAESVSKFLEHRNYGEVRAIHGNKGQNTRINSMEAFKGGDVRFLVATDVAARGIDVTMVSHVINFDVPLIYEDYVHRIGRTGRAEQEGAAITFATDAEMYHVNKIEKIIRMQIPEVPMPAEVKVFETPFEEQQEMAMDIDRQKRRENPDFKGAFHEKKGRHKSNFEKGKKKGDPKNSFWQKTKKKGSRKK